MDALIAYELIQSGTFGLNEVTFSETEHAIGVMIPLVEPEVQRDFLTRDFPRRPANVIQQEDADRGFLIFIYVFFLLTGCSSYLSLVIAMFALSWLTSLGVFVVGKRLRDTITGWLSFAGFIGFFPFIGLASEIRIHWFVLPAIVAVSLFCSTEFNKKWHIATSLILLAFVLGCLSFIRSTIFPLALLPVLHLAINSKFTKQFLVYMLLFCSVILATKASLNSVLVSLGGKAPYHTIWFPIYVGLGEMPEKFSPSIPPTPEDGYGYDRAKELKPDAEFWSAEWDEALRNEVLLLLSQRPDLFFELYVLRITRILHSTAYDWQRISPPIGRGLLRIGYPILGIIGILYICFGSNRLTFNRYLFLILAMCSFLFMAQSVLVMMKNPRYYMGWTFLYCFSMPFAFLAMKDYWENYKTLALSIVERFVEWRRKQGYWP